MIEQDSSDDCAACTSGKACTRYALTEYDYPCSPGYYCPGGNYKPNQTEYACPAGTYTDYNNLTAVEQCDTCRETVACKFYWYFACSNTVVPPDVVLLAFNLVKTGNK